MALSIYNIKKWWKMLTGKSIYHVNQNEGKIYSFESIRGYYNNMTEKITLDKERYYSEEVITVKDEKNVDYYFPIAVFQYGLGAYDLFLLGKDKELMHKKFFAQLEWAFENQNENGSWKNFEHAFPKSPYSAMAQGEGCSILIRGYVDTGNKKYLDAARKALDFMLVSLEDGGTSEYVDGGVILYEFTCFPYVYNGWMFAIFGLMDYVIATGDKKYNDVLNKTLLTFKSKMNEMDNGYWSMYRNDKMIASPFYHNLHIAQLNVLYKYSGHYDFYLLAKRFEKYKNNPFKRFRAFFVKSCQKIFERRQK